MREFSQTNGCGQPPAKRKPRLPLGGGFRLARWLGVAVLLGLSSPGFAQNLRLGPFVFAMTAQGDVGYDSNVDGFYPEEETPGLEKWDFYWMPTLSLRSQAVPLAPSITLDVSASAADQDYF